MTWACPRPWITYSLIWLVRMDGRVISLPFPKRGELGLRRKHTSLQAWWSFDTRKVQQSLFRLLNLIVMTPG